jgi:Glyoxalase-like domain
MTLTLGPLLVDAAEPAAVARFWRSALGDTAFQRQLLVRPQRQPKTVKNTVHPDVYVHHVEPLLALGAEVLAEYLPERVTLADVEGNEFCAFFEPSIRLDTAARIFAICVDSARPEELAAWWAPLVGARVGNGPDGTPRWLSGAAGWTDVTWKFVRVPTTGYERSAPNRWQGSLSGAADELLAAGASVSGDGTVVDPQGNAFRLAAGPVSPAD